MVMDIFPLGPDFCATRADPADSALLELKLARESHEDSASAGLWPFFLFFFKRELEEHPKTR